MKFLFLFIPFLLQAFELKEIEHSEQGDRFLVEYIFDQKVPDTYSLEFINSTIQVDLSGAELANKKRFTSIEDERVKNLYTYQLKDDLLRMRINYKEQFTAEDFKERVSVNLFDNRMIVEVKDGRGAMPEKVTKPIFEKNALKVSAADFSEPKPKAIAKTDENKKEYEIPVFLKTEPKKAKAKSSFWKRLLYSLGILAVLSVFGFFGLRQWKKSRIANPGTSIKVITQHYLGPKKSLAVVRIAGESILIGVTDHTITHIKDLALLEEEVPEIENTFTDSLYNADQKIDAPEAEEDQFALTGIKDLVSDRLKNMRQL